jgi:hypothetical protein
MYVRLLVALAGSSGPLSGQPGDVRVGPDDICRKFIDAGLVERMDPIEPVEPPAQVMAALPSEIRLEIVAGPTLRAALDVLDLIEEVAPLIPEWHAAERAELLSRAKALQETALRGLNAAGGKK